MAVEEGTQGGDFKMRFFNSDGSLGEMCGNGARCICRYGYERGLAGPIQRVETTAGLIVGTRLGPDSYRVQLNLPSVLESQRVTSLGPAGYVELGQPGVPHAILRVPGLEERSLEELRSMGQTLRHDHAFPKGANANLYDVLSQDHLVIRTFERGVEDFTYACGTGTGSLVALAHSPGPDLRPRRSGGKSGGTAHCGCRTDRRSNLCPPPHRSGHPSLPGPCPGRGPAGRINQIKAACRAERPNAASSLQAVFHPNRRSGRRARAASRFSRVAALNWVR